MASWYLTDRQGTVQGNTDASGTLSNKNTYDGFGARTNQTNASASDRYLYTSRELQVDSGLQYTRARWYDTRTGSWTTIDPKGFDAGDDNLYRYVKNGPTNATDPSGEYLIAENEKARDDAIDILLGNSAEGKRKYWVGQATVRSARLPDGKYVIWTSDLLGTEGGFRLSDAGKRAGFDLQWLEKTLSAAHDPNKHVLIRGSDTSWSEYGLRDIAGPFAHPPYGGEDRRASV